MALLSDIVPITQLKPDFRKHKDALAKIQKAVEDAVAANKLAANPAYRSEMLKVVKKAQATEVAAILEVVKQTGTLPSDLLAQLPESSYMRAIALSPKAKLSVLRDLADKLGLVIIPTAFFASSGVPEEVLPALHAFKDALKSGFDRYILTPVGNYDVGQHVLDNATHRQIYAGRPIEQAFLSLELILPVLKGITRRLLDQEATLKSIRSDVQGLASRVSTLETRSQQEREAALALENDSLSPRVGSLLGRDPLVFAVPQGTNLTSGEAFAILGPCWGSEFDEEALKTLGYTVVPGQRALLDASSKGLVAISPTEKPKAARSNVFQHTVERTIEDVSIGVGASPLAASRAKLAAYKKHFNATTHRVVDLAVEDLLASFTK